MIILFFWNRVNIIIISTVIILMLKKLWSGDKERLLINAVNQKTTLQKIEVLLKSRSKIAI